MKFEEVDFQFEITKNAIREGDDWTKILMHLGRLEAVVNQYLTQLIIKKKEEFNMDKKMHKITKKMKTAEKDIKKGKGKEAVRVLKGAEKKNEKLVREDRDVRDPLIEKAKKAKKILR